MYIELYIYHVLLLHVKQYGVHRFYSSIQHDLLVHVYYVNISSIYMHINVGEGFTRQRPRIVPFSYDDPRVSEVALGEA